MKWKLMCLMAVLMMSSLAMADYLVTSYINNDTGYVYRLDDSIKYQTPWNLSDFIIWQSVNQRSVNQLMVNPLNGQVIAGLNGTDRMAKQYNIATGALLATSVPAGDYVNNLTYGYDWNGDGVPDLWTVSRNAMYVYDGAATGGMTAAPLLTSWTIANTSGNNGTGGSAILYGPDQNGDGISDMYVGKGSNDGNGRINVYDAANSTASTLVQLASYSASSTRDIGDMILGPDYNNDGQLDLLVVSSRNYQLRAYNYKTGTDLGVIDEGLTGRYYPLDISMLPNGSLLLGTRMKSELDPGWISGAETGGGNLIRLDPVAGITIAYTPTLLAIPPQAGDFRFTGVASILPNAYAPVPLDGKKVTLDLSQVSWTNPDPNNTSGVITCDVWFSENYPEYLPYPDPNLLKIEDPNERGEWWLKNRTFESYATKVVGNQPINSLNLAEITSLPLTFGKTYYWRVDVRDSSNVEQGTVIGEVWRFTADNAPPVVDAGTTVYTWLTDGTTDVTLAPTVTDDGRPLPPGVTTVLWTLDAGTAESITINNPTAQNSTVTITATGVYTLKLTASDNELVASDTMVINVYANACAAAQGAPGYVRPTADFDNDCDVDLADFNTLAAQWLESTALTVPIQ